GLQSNPLVGAGVGARLLTGAHLLARAFSLLAAPLVLSADYSYAEITPIHTIWRLDVLFGFALYALIPLRAWYARKRQPALTLASLLFLVAWLPIANLAFLIPTIFAERLLYLPSLGICLALALAVRHHPGA